MYVCVSSHTLAICKCQYFTKFLTLSAYMFERHILLSHLIIGLTEVLITNSSYLAVQTPVTLLKNLCSCSGQVRLHWKDPMI